MEPRVGVLVEGAVQHGADGGADALEVFHLDGVGRLVHDLVEDGGCGVAAEGFAAAQALVEHHAHREEVAAGVGLAGADVLRRHVAHGAHDRPRGGHIGVADLGHAEIHDFGVEATPVALHADVGGLDVPVDDVLAVGETQAVTDLGQDLQGLGAREGLLLEQLVQVMPLYELHGDVEHALVLAEFVDGHQIRMIQHPGGSRLAGKALLSLATLGHGGKDGLDGHLAADGGIHAEVYLPHGAVPEHPLDLEFSELLKHGRDPRGMKWMEEQHRSTPAPGQGTWDISA